MKKGNGVSPALIVSGDERIQDLLDREDSVVIPAFACRLDGFVNDTFTEYANASVYRPASVCKARLVSTLQDTIRATGKFYLGLTMYTAAGEDEEATVWIGHRQVARTSIPDPDNRVHLFIAPEPFEFKGGEPIRIVTSETTGACRIENVVLLSRKPRITSPDLKIVDPRVDLEHAEDGIQARVTWLTDRPATGRLWYRSARVLTRSRKVSGPLMSHETVLEDLKPNREYHYEIRMRDRTRKLEVVHSGTFRTAFSKPVSKTRKGRILLELRRKSTTSGVWPVSVGVPFPKGRLGSSEEIRLRRGRKEIPLQTRTLASWPDGSVRWALLDFQGDGAGDCVVDFGRDVKRSKISDPIQVASSRAGIEVTTGPIRVVFPRSEVRFPGVVYCRQADGEYVKVSADEPDPAVVLVGDNGTRFMSQKPDEVVLEEAGPERVCVRVAFPHRSRSKTLFRSILRVHLFRNRSDIQVLHTFENDRVEEEFTRIRELSLRSQFELGEHYSGKIGGRGLELKKGASVLQLQDKEHSVLEGRDFVSSGDRHAGDAELAGDMGRVTLASRNFWQNYPKGLKLDPDAFTIQICPPIGKEEYPRGGELEDRLFYYLLDGRYKLKAGVSKTHEFWFHFGGSEEASRGLSSRVQMPPLYAVPLEAFNKSQAVTRLPDRSPSPYPDYERWVASARTAYSDDRESSRAFGMLNFGDWFGERTYNWGNMEYDTPWCFLQEFLRGGHSDFYTWAEEAAHHLVDVDTCHYSQNVEAVGSQYIHSVGHVGGYYPDGFRERAIFGGRSSVSHTWVEGLFLYHLLTGDARALQGAMGASDLLVGEMLNDYDFTNCRNSGWHLIHLSAAYKTTGRKVYLNAARIIVERVLERQRASGGWDRLMVPGHCHCDPPRHTGNAGFMVGILMVGLKRFYEATGEKRVADAIVRAAGYCIDEMWVPKTKTFHYTSCPESSIGGTADIRILKGVAAAYQFSGEKRFLNVLKAGVASTRSKRVSAHRGVGKSICSPMRGAPQVMIDLRK